MACFTQDMHSAVVAYSPRPDASPAAIPGENRWVEVALAVVQAAVKMSKEMQFANWQDEVSQSLREIIVRLEAIQAQLANLQVWIDERITEESRRNLHRQIVSLASDINTTLVTVGMRPDNHLSEDERRDLAENFRTLRLTITALQHADGYAHVVSVIVGVVVAVPLFALFGRQDSMAEWSVDILAYLHRALDINEPKSVAFARNQAALRYIAEKAALDQILSREWKTNFTPFQDTRHLVDEADRAPGGGSGRPIGVPAHAILQGAAIVNERDIVRTSVTPVRGEGGTWFPGLTRRYDCDEGAEASFADMAALLAARLRKTWECAGRESSLLEQMDAIDAITESLRAQLT